MKYLFTLIVVFLPFVSWYGQYCFSKKENLLGSFKKHWTCYYGDWIFVLINLFFLFSVKISAIILYLFLISLLVNLYTHLQWGKENKINQLSYHFFLDKADKLNGAGIVHLVFSTMQMSIILATFILKPTFPFIYFEMFLIFIFGIFAVYGSYKIHSRIKAMDFLAALIIFILIALKIIFLI